LRVTNGASVRLLRRSGMAVVGVWVFELAEAYCDLLRSGGLIASVTEEVRSALPMRPAQPTRRQRRDQCSPSPHTTTTTPTVTHRPPSFLCRTTDTSALVYMWWGGRKKTLFYYYPNPTHHQQSPKSHQQPTPKFHPTTITPQNLTQTIQNLQKLIKLTLTHHNSHNQITPKHTIQKNKSTHAKKTH